MVQEHTQAAFYTHARTSPHDSELTYAGVNDYNRPTFTDDIGGRFHYIPFGKMPETQCAVAALLKGDGTMPYSPISDVVERNGQWYSYEKAITDADRESLAQFPHQYVVGRMLQAFIFCDTDFFSMFTKEKNTKRDVVNSDFALTYDTEQAYYGLGRPPHYAFETPEFRSWFAKRTRAECHAALGALKHMHAFIQSAQGVEMIRGIETYTKKKVTELFNFNSTGRSIHSFEEFHSYMLSKIAATIGIIEYGPTIVQQFQPTRGYR
ncbi:MAG: hypothetical protein RI911_745 [Candidatus Parcubacteria bacterium]|jgi:hypothetical protein